MNVTVQSTGDGHVRIAKTLAASSDHSLVSCFWEDHGDESVRLVLLCRHADMADERDASTGELDAVAVAGTMLESMKASTRPAEALAASNAVAVASDAYYSALLAVFNRNDGAVSVAAIGNTDLTMLQGGSLRDVVRPNIVRTGGGGGVLSASLGLGFVPEAIQLADLRLEPGSRLCGSVRATIKSPQFALTVRDHAMYERTAEVALREMADVASPALVLLIDY